MEFSCDRKSLLAAARRAAKAAATNSKVDILNGILLTADADNFKLSLAATNLNVSITCTVAAPVTEGGSVVVGASLFTEMLSLMKGQTVEVKLYPNHQLELSSDTARYLVACLPAENFPTLDFPKPTEEVEISGLKRLAKQTVFAVAKTGNQVMQCVKLELSGSALRAIGCDGNILALSQREMEAGKPAQLLIPAAGFSKLAELAGDDEKLLLSTDGKQAVFRCPEQGMTFAARLGNGSYLDTDSVLAAVTKQYEAIVDAAEFRRALDRINTLPGVSLMNLVFSLGQISLSCATDQGTASDSVPAQIPVAMPQEGFYYPARKLYQGVQTMSGPVPLVVSDTGLLLASGGEQSFLQTPSAKPMAKAVKKSKTKKTETKKPAAKAA